MAVTTGVIADDFTGATDIASFMAEPVSYTHLTLPTIA